jgi:ABC-type sugar transport system ATPase subunit
MVMYNGRIQGFLQHDTATEENIMAMASGINQLS